MMGVSVMETENIITIGKKDYSFREEDILQNMLKFYPENPRIYSSLVIDGAIPEQEEIEDQLINMEHVKTLRLSIEANGGLIDSLIVRDGDFVVLEGNSRLAAYRMLVKKDPIKWGKVKCKVLPKEITDEAIFNLLGQYHIVGRQDWSPFEQAGYLWRRIHNNDVLPDKLAQEMGLSPSRTKKMVEVYDFMKEHNNVDPQKWSYYEEYLKSRSINQARLEIPELDIAVAFQIRTGVISQAIDIRKKLEPVTKILSAKKRKKVLKDFVSGESSLDECFETAELSGVNTSILQDLVGVRKRLNALNERKQITTLSDEDQKKCQYEVKKIRTRVGELEKHFCQKASNMVE
jgi:hypothetical protein